MDGGFASPPPGMVLDRYTGSTLDGSVIVTDYNPRDTSLGVYGVNDANPTGATSINVNDIADNDSLYLSGEKDKNILSIGHWFSDPSSGDSFFGKDRTTATNRWLLPHKSGPTSNTQLTKTHFDDMAVQMIYQMADPTGAYLVVAPPELGQRWRNEIGQDILINYPLDESRGRKLVASYGFDLAMFRHPALGILVINEDPLCTPNTVTGLRLNDWETLYASKDRFDWEPGDVDMWYRMNSSTPGNGKTTTWQADGWMATCDICLAPRAQWRIINVTA